MYVKARKKLKLHGMPNILNNSTKEISGNIYGVIQMGLAENQLCHDLIEDLIRKNPKVSICTTEGVSEFKSIANFQDYHGLPAFRQAMAKFMEKVRGGNVKFDPERIVMNGGATGAQELLAFCLADPGDAFLIPTPYYPGSIGLKLQVWFKHWN